MTEKLNNFISQGQTETALQLIMNSEENPTGDDDLWETIKDIALQNVSRLNILKKEKRLGLIKTESFEIENNRVNWNAIKLVTMMEENDFEDLDELGIEEEDNSRKQRIREASVLDKGFKALLLVLLLISIGVFFRSALMTSEDFQERILQLSIASVGGFGSSMGYFRWRAIELR